MFNICKAYLDPEVYLRHRLLRVCTILNLQVDPIQRWYWLFMFISYEFIVSGSHNQTSYNRLVCNNSLDLLKSFVTSKVNMRSLKDKKMFFIFDECDRLCHFVFHRKVLLTRCILSPHVCDQYHYALGFWHLEHTYACYSPQNHCKIPTFTNKNISLPNCSFLFFL